MESEKMKGGGMCVHGNFPANQKTCCGTTNETKENAEQDFEKRLKNVELLRPGVEQAVLLDAYLETAGEHSLENFAETYGITIDKISENLQERFSVTIDRYDEIARQQQITQQSLETMASERFGSTSQENLGAVVFQGICGKGNYDTTTRPSNAVIASVEGAFLVVFAQGDDYDRMSRSPESGGTYHRSEVTSLVYRHEELLPNILMVKGTPDREHVRRTVDHERQHFINGEWMKEKKDRSPLERNADMTKDEVLAYLKDGRSPTDINEYLHENLYAHLFDGLKPEEKSKLDDLLKQTMDSLNDAHALFPTKASRAVLVYHLIDVPFERFPNVIHLLATYERRKGGPAESFAVPGKVTEYVTNEVDFDSIPPDLPPDFLLDTKK